MVLHNGAFDAVVVGRGKEPSGGDAARRHVVDGVKPLLVELRDFGIMDITRDKNHAIGTGFFDEVEHALALVREVGPCLVAIERDTELSSQTQ